MRFGMMGAWALLSLAIVSGVMADKGQAGKKTGGVKTVGAANRNVTVAQGDVVPAVSREFRGVWVATVENIDWPSKRGLPTDKQKAELVAIMDKAAQLHLNAVVFQVRPTCDALYDSQLEPWSEYLTGTQGQAPEPYYDPLAFAIDEAHKRGMELHAWINPYRARHPSSKSTAPNHISKTQPGIVRKYGTHLWLDPGEPDTQEWSRSVIMDIVKRYDVDGIHVDDYFYPYRENDKNKKEIPFPDDASYKKYTTGGGTLGRDDWRRENVNQFIQKVYSSVKAEKPWVKVGISPFGIYRPGQPAQIKGFDAYQEIYCDSQKWLREGWCDYLAPQLYWPIAQTPQSYPVLLKWWTEQNVKGRHIWAGNYTSRVADGGTKSYSVDEVVNQVQATRSQLGATGNVHFSMEVLLHDRKGLDERLMQTVYQSPALIPASPWLSNKQPGQPLTLIQIDPNTNDVKLAWSAPQSDTPAQWVVQTRQAGTWKTQILPGKQGGLTINSAGNALNVDMVALSLVDRYGNQGKPFVFELKPTAANGTTVSVQTNAAR